MFTLWTKRLLLFCFTGTAFVLAMPQERRLSSTKEKQATAKAIDFLVREVPAWSKNNGCFSCHNDGDAARALYAATQKGYTVPASALAATTAWLSQPLSWEQNKGDPGFSDKRLANLQFAVALRAASAAGQVKEKQALQLAARKLVAEQAVDGAWHIEPAATLGSPATWGTALATVMALKTLQEARSEETAAAIFRAERWLRQASPTSVMMAATLLMAAADGTDEWARRRQQDCIRLLGNAQTVDGGWGPYKDSPPEPFDTALALLALAAVRHQPGIAAKIERGRAFLLAEQQADGSWPETTRPAGGESYAQRLSTTGWATLALLATEND